MLSPTLINQIAAGEVVERPASVVKELLENAVDAGSTRIDVEVAQGGIDLIQVVDNGCGIQAEDLPLAFASHATSKLADVEGLSQIGTLGFRGEALASIGSIAQVTLQSRPPEQPFGAEIICNGGVLSPAKPWNGSPGTRIEVRHLFYHTPARRKFLKDAATEMGHVSEAFTRLALARSGLHWTLKHNGRLVQDVPASMGLLDRIGLFFGTEVANSLYRVEAEQGPVKLSGYIADPSCDRGNAQMQYLFLNGRWVRDRALFQAVQEAYKGLLMTARYPVAFLFLEMPPDQVDVNVHPAKTEVRFRDKDDLFVLVRNTVRNCLHGADLTARMPLHKKVRLPTAESSPQTPLPQEEQAGTPVAEERQLPFPAPGGMPAAARSTIPAPVPQIPPRPLPASARSTEKVLPPLGVPVAAATGLFPPAGDRKQPPAMQGQKRDGTSAASLPTADLKALQVLECYLVVEVSPNEVLFIDQHALHERILYEQFQERLRSGTLEVQRLLIPEPVELPSAQAAVVLEQREALAELGLLVEDFGSGTVLLAGYPVVLGKRAPKGVFQAVVDQLIAKERVPSREQLLNDLVSLMACHAAVRAGDRLTQEEIRALLDQRELAQDSHHCPHGRPTSIRFTRHDLEKMFKRV